VAGWKKPSARYWCAFRKRCEARLESLWKLVTSQGRRRRLEFRVDIGLVVAGLGFTLNRASVVFQKPGSSRVRDSDCSSEAEKRGRGEAAMYLPE